MTNHHSGDAYQRGVLFWVRFVSGVPAQLFTKVIAELGVWGWLFCSAIWELLFGLPESPPAAMSITMATIARFMGAKV